MGRETRVALAVFLVAFGLRAVLLGQHAFHMDEALYAGFSRRILHGDLLLTGGLNNDKPPFQFYWGALGLGFFGESESAIRLMNATLSAMECGLLAWALVPVAGSLAALGAGLLLACSPLHRAYGATAIMDGPLSLFMLASFVLASKGRAGYSGLLWGLACASKQTAMFLLPWPVLALILSHPDWRQACKDWALGAALLWAPLLLWSGLFAHPRLGAFIGMSAHQPEVGLRLDGLGVRIQQWIALSGGLIPWPAVLPGALGLGALVGLWSLLRTENRAWGLALLFPLYGILLFAAMNMRPFDRYPLPYAWTVCASPAIVAAAFAAGSWGRRLGGGFSLALGVAALLWVRTQALPLDNQGAAGNASDGYRALLVDLKPIAPEGSVLVSGQGGLRWMGGWYLGNGWTLIEPSEQPPQGRALFAAEREGSVPPAGHRWKLLARYDKIGPPPAWMLYQAQP